MEMSQSDKNINYSSLIAELAENEHFSRFMEVYSNYTDNPYSYTDSPLYKHCLQLFTPKAYCHPTFVDCDVSCWDMFLQLIWVNREAECKFVYTEGTNPELVFSYLSLKEVAASTLSPEEFRPLLLCLLTDAFAAILPHILSSQIDHISFAQVTDYKTLSRNDIAHHFGCNEQSSTEHNEFVDWLYSRLSDYYSQTR